MTRYLIDVCHYTHTCPAQDGPHDVHTARTLVATTSDGPCRQPQIVRSGRVTVTVDCGRLLPSERQCCARRTVIEVRTETTVHWGRYVPPTRPAPSGDARYPCTVCGEPLAAVLEPWGTHLLCDPYRPQRRLR